LRKNESGRGLPLSCQFNPEQSVEPENPMHVELRDIHKHFGSLHANDGISLTFEPGRIYGVLGENGAGKSTLMKILSGFQHPTSGQILLNQKPVLFNSPSHALARGVGMMYQDPLDFPPMRVVENLQLAYDNKLVPNLRVRENELVTLGKRFGFAIDPRAYVDDMTMGERQQMELLRLLALGAEVLILDEPTTGISAEQKEVLFGTMRRLAREESKTIILVSHKLQEVQELCNEVSVLRKGKWVGTKSIPCPTVEMVNLMFGEELPRAERISHSQGNTVLKASHLAVHTYQLNIDNIDLDLHSGETLGLAGLEGSGQQLLIKGLAGLLPLYSGKVELDTWKVKGKRSVFFWLPWLATIVLVGGAVWMVIRLLLGQVGGIAAVGELAESSLIAGAIWLIGAVVIAWTSHSAYHMFQDKGGAYVPAGRLEEALIPDLSLTEHMALTADSKSLVINWKESESEIARRIERFNIKGKPDTLVNKLSGGNQQRAMLALLKTPLRVLMLEHPTRGLDVTSANSMWELFEERLKEGTVIIFISADLDELLERSDRIAVFVGGKMSQVVQTAETSVEDLGHLIGGGTV
jgi:general nucleoside transport system ATP-binding protein